MNTTPRVTMGESRVVFSAAQALYSASDIGGWTNLAVYFNAQKKVSGLKMYKSLPSGEIYDVGTVCGTVPKQ